MELISVVALAKYRNLKLTDMNHFTQKNKQLEKLRGIFFQTGLIVAGGLTLVAFEWTTPLHDDDVPKPKEIIELPIEYPPITFQDDPIKPKVKMIIAPVNNPDKIEIVDDNVVEPVDKIDLFDVQEFNPDDFAPEPEPVEPPEVFTIVEKMPGFVGGERARLKFLSDNLKYPSIDRSGGIQGTVYLNFVVNKKGQIKKVKILRGVSPTIDKEAIRVVEAMPNWEPGKQRGKPVSVSYNFRIKFNLN